MKSPSFERVPFQNSPQSSSQTLKAQYERHPYPPISSWALPLKGQGTPLRFENAGRFLSKSLSSENIRILVVGGGTLEPLVVAQTHPNASEILNIDLSHRSIAVLKRRTRLHRLARPLSKVPPIKNICGDFLNFSGEDFNESFDYAIASNVLHHMETPVHALAGISKSLKIGGILRVVTYPKASRVWMRATSRWLKLRQVDRAPDIKKAALQAVRELPISHPIRACYESHQERMTEAGIIDAFFNACENPFSPLEWQAASGVAGLKLIGETQDENSHSELVGGFLGERSDLIDRWKKLQILDDTWELCANPILWFEKIHEPAGTSPETTQYLEKAILEQINEGAKRADSLLHEANSSLSEWIEWLKKEVGPRTWPSRPDELLRGLSMTEYPVAELLGETLFGILKSSTANM